MKPYDPFAAMADSVSRASMAACVQRRVSQIELNQGRRSIAEKLRLSSFGGSRCQYGQVSPTAWHKAGLTWLDVRALSYKPDRLFCPGARFRASVQSKRPYSGIRPDRAPERVCPLAAYHYFFRSLRTVVPQGPEMLSRSVPNDRSLAT
jgi:hypothetical protein